MEFRAAEDSLCQPLFMQLAVQCWVRLLVPTQKREHGHYTKPITRLEPELWPEIQAGYAAGQTPRDLTGHYEESYEAIRGIVQRSIQGVA